MPPYGIRFSPGNRGIVAPPLTANRVFFAMFAQTKKGSLVQRELARQRLRDCKGVEFTGKKKKIVCVRNNPSAARSAAPPFTQGRLRSALPVVKILFQTAGAYGMPPYGIRF